MSSRSLLAFTWFVSLTSALACGPRDERAASAARAQEWAAIESERQTLTQLRAQLAAAREREAAKEPELQTRVDEATDRFLERLVTFINQHAGGQGEARPAEVGEAIRTKSAEDLLVARDYIERGGDYARAIDILEGAREVDPGNQELEAALADAQRLRYMDEERFSRVEKGMTESDVRRELGQVKLHNVRPYEDGKVIAWLYPREGGAAAAVFFRAQGSQLIVFDTNFDAVESAAERALEGGPAEGGASD